MAFKPKFTRTSDKDNRGRFSSGKHAVGICHRSGFKVPYRRLKFEPGTNLLVDVAENDGEYSLVAHPQNFLPESKVERIGLRWSFPDVPLSIGTIVSADQLFLPVHALSVNGQFIILDDNLASIGTATSADPGMVFTSSGASMYYIVLFAGI